MQFVIAQTQFAEALARVGRGLSTKNTIPVLSGILLEGREHQLVLRSTDMEWGVRVTTQAQVAEMGSIVLPGKTLIEMIKRLPAGDVQVAVDPKNFTATIKAGKSRYTLHGFAAENFPNEPEGGKNVIAVAPSVLRDVISKTAIAVGHDESKPWLTGVQFTVREQELTAIATDGVRIAHVRAPIQNPDDVGASVIVPGKALTELGRMLKTDAEVKISLSDTNISFEIGDTRVTSRLLEGKYPDVMRLVPQAYPMKATFNRGDMIESINRASLVASGAIKLTMTPEAEALSIEAEKAEAGRGKEEVLARYEGESLVIGFNPAFVLDGLGQADGTDITWEFVGPRHPARITSTNGQGVRFTYVLLPLITL